MQQGVSLKQATLLLSLCSIIFVDILYAFDVKILLQKYSITDSVQVGLHSKFGFIISSDPELSIGYKEKKQNLIVSINHGAISVDQKQSKEKTLFLYPALSDVQVNRLQQYVHEWFDQNIQELDLKNQDGLHALFDNIVSNGSVEDQQYQNLINAVEEIIEIFLQDFLSSIDQKPLIGLQKLKNYVHDLYVSKIKLKFLELVAQEQLSKQERRVIEKNKQQRYEFFESKLYQVARQLTLEFILIIPAKLQHQFLQDEANNIQFDQNKYLGSFIVFQEKNQILLINNLDIDDYLISVIRYEGWPGWPLEMNKVLAMICRTYLIWQILQAQKLNRAYHIENGIKHQTYKGHHVDAKMKQAVEQTRDMFVAFDGKPALTMYDACCGGIIPGYIDDLAHKNISYLARTYPCTFCKNFKIFHWQYFFTEYEVLKRLEADFPKIKKVVDMCVTKRDRAGLVKKISINVGSRKIVITEKKMKLLFPEIKSMQFNIQTHTNSNKKFEIAGKGYGHHKGLCQWGAYKLVKDDSWTFEQVLQFYYPGTTIMKLSYQR